MIRTVFAALSFGLTFVAFLPYVRSIRRGETKPHVFSWVLWGITTSVVFAAQLASEGGAGAWPTGLSGAITFYVAWSAYRGASDRTITSADRLFFGLALGGLVAWGLTSDPLWAVVLLTVVDLLGFAPTFRKAHENPFEEEPTFYVLVALRYLLSVFALERISITTALFPVAVAAACLLFVLMLVHRRRALRRDEPAPREPPR